MERRNMHREFIQVLTLAAVGSVLVGCGIVSKISSGSALSLTGTGPVKSEPRTVTDFDEVEIGGNFEVAVKVGPATSVKLDAQENLLKEIRTTTKDGVLKIDSDYNMESDKPILITITTPKLTSISGSGATNIKVDGVEGATFRADLSGASKIKVTGNADEVKLDGSGAAEFIWDGLKTKSLAVSQSGGCSTLVSGSTDSLALDLSGGCTFKGEKLEAQSGVVEASGGCNVVVNVLKTLNIDASGGGNIRYIGDPTLNQEVSGGVEVSKIP
jgi:hypothetical protein